LREKKGWVENGGKKVGKNIKLKKKGGGGSTTLEI